MTPDKSPDKKDLIVKGGIALFVVFLLFNIFSGSGPKIDSALKKQVKAVPGMIDAARDRVRQEEKKYSRLKSSKKAAAVAAIADKEKWENRFAAAAQTLDQAREQYKTALKPLLKKKNKDPEAEITPRLKAIQETIQKADALSREPAERFTGLAQVLAEPARFLEKAGTDAGFVNRRVEVLQGGIVAKALADFPDMADKINARFAPARKLAAESDGLLKDARTQYAAIQSGSPDWTAFFDTTQALSAHAGEMKTLDQSLEKDFGQLYTSYTKILKDMKTDFFVTVKRESWNENSDYYDPRFATFTRQVSPETYEKLTADNLDAIAAIKAGFTGSRFSSKVGAAWNELNIDPGEQWPGKGHNAATFFIEESRAAHFHKYILEQDGQTEETGWQQVSEEFYENNLEYLGMAILAKPFGAFEQDRLTQPAPPGMAYVGNPKYGEWKEDDKGGRFWSWYGKYMFFSNLFFFPPSYFYYNSWNGWRNNYRHRRPYFGQTANGLQKFGTRGAFIKKSPGFQSTHFARSGGFKSQAASVKGASSGLRGGGPGTRGK